METPIVKVENLSHRYNIQWAIRDINFEITRNGVYGLLGSNGAGKSTTYEYYVRGIEANGRQRVH